MSWLSLVLFILLSPGVLLTIPPGSRGIFMSGQTSLVAVVVHGVIFLVVCHFIWEYLKRNSMTDLVKISY
jgi:hypothetical protein